MGLWSESPSELVIWLPGWPHSQDRHLGIDRLKLREFHVHFMDHHFLKLNAHPDNPLINVIRRANPQFGISVVHHFNEHCGRTV